MKLNKSLLNLLGQFNMNWERHQSRLCLDFREGELQDCTIHPLKGELVNLIEGKGGSLPYFADRVVIWCTLAPAPPRLRETVEQLEAWILPSYGWRAQDDGYRTPTPEDGPFQQAMADLSPTNYFRWRSTLKDYPQIERRLALRDRLQAHRPARERRRRPSLYELRTRFRTALILGDRGLAGNAVDLIDYYELDRALNTQMMRIRLWHHFREFEKIRRSSYLPSLLTQPDLPATIRECIREAAGTDLEPEVLPQRATESVVEPERDEWGQFFCFLIDQRNPEASRAWLDGESTESVPALHPDQIHAYAEWWDSVFVDDELQEQNRALINEALVRFLGDFVREPGFPRPSLARLYLSLLRLWGAMNGGINIGREQGHVLLELANALLGLNFEINEAKRAVEDWWRTRPVPSQLPFALDAIELLAAKHPDTEAAANLWIEAADQAQRNSQDLLESEKMLWRSTGSRIGLDEGTIHEYFPVELDATPTDPLNNAGLTRIAIVCMREEQARQAAEAIEDRTGAGVAIVSSKVAGTETSQACTCDVILFVWMATTHAVFRGFDRVDRSRLCYVQGTGAASIVRSLERWVLVDQPN